MDSDITYTLSVASFDAPTPQDQLVLPLGTFKWNDSVKRMAEQETAKAQENTPSEWDVTRWSVRPELSWTFGKIETGPSLTWGVIGTIFTLGLPVVTLLTLVSAASNFVLTRSVLNGTSNHSSPTSCQISTST